MFERHIRQSHISLRMRIITLSGISRSRYDQSGHVDDHAKPTTGIQQGNHVSTRAMGRIHQRLRFCQSDDGRPSTSCHRTPLTPLTPLVVQDDSQSKICRRSSDAGRPESGKCLSILLVTNAEELSRLSWQKYKRYHNHTSCGRDSPCSRTRNPARSSHWQRRISLV